MGGMAWTRLTAAAVSALALAVAPTVRAQDASGTDAPSAPDEGSGTTGGTDAEARALFDAGRVAFDEGRFENALEHFRRAYELSDRPGLLYNIGTAADRLRRDREALEAFERYLDLEPQSQHRVSTEARILALRRAVADDERGPAPVPASGAGPGPAPWIVVGISGALAVAGGALFGVALADMSAIENVPDGETWANLADDVDRVRGLSGAGIAALAVGGAGLVVGVVWAVAGGGGESAQVRVGPGGLVIAGRFQ